ncbi:MAG: UbiA family prenyltransferase, partial [Nanoarchaeota archaeon]|nr:UbiA family prenyltransferase [Nanoarchaeota archaeon]
MQKSFFESAINFLLKSNIYIALGASCVAYITLFLMNLSSNPIILSIIFFEFFIAYNLNRLTDFDEDAINAPERRLFVNKYTKPLITAGVMIYIYLLLQVIAVNLYAFLFIFVQTLFGLVYSVYRIKKYFLIKNIYIAIVWGMIIIFVGLYNSAFTMPLLLFSLIISALFFINTIISDIK